MSSRCCRSSSGSRGGHSKRVSDAEAALAAGVGAALWQVDIQDIAKQTHVSPELLLGALVHSAAPHDHAAEPIIIPGHEARVSSGARDVSGPASTPAGFAGPQSLASLAPVVVQEPMSGVVYFALDTPQPGSPRGAVSAHPGLSLSPSPFRDPSDRTEGPGWEPLFPVPSPRDPVGEHDGVATGDTDADSGTAEAALAAPAVSVASYESPGPHALPSIAEDGGAPSPSHASTHHAPRATGLWDSPFYAPESGVPLSPQHWREALRSSRARSHSSVRLRITPRDSHAASHAPSTAASGAGGRSGVIGLLARALCAPDIEDVMLVSEAQEIPLEGLVASTARLAADVVSLPPASVAEPLATSLPRDGVATLDELASAVSRLADTGAAVGSFRHDGHGDTQGLYLLAVDRPPEAAPHAAAASVNGELPPASDAISAMSVLSPRDGHPGGASAQTIVFALPGVLDQAMATEALGVAPSSRASLTLRAPLPSFPNAEDIWTPLLSEAPPESELRHAPSVLADAVADVLDYELPSDIVDVTVARTGTKAEPELGINVRRRLPWQAYAILVAAVLGASTYDISMLLLEPGGNMLKRAWRGQCALAVCLPWLAANLARQRTATLRALADPHLVLGAVLTGAGSAAFSGCYIASLSYTSLAHAFLLNNAHTIVLLVRSAATLFHAAPLKLIGTLVTMLGALLTCFDIYGPGQGADKLPDGVHCIGRLCVPMRAIGDTIACGGAIGGVLMLLVSKLQRTDMVLSVFITIMTATTVVLFLAWSAVADNHRPTPTCSPESGVFGYLAPCHWVGDFVAGPLSSIMGSVGYIAVLKYFDALAMANVMLSDQIVGNFFFRLCFHEAPWPRRLTWLGSAVTALGVAATVLASRIRITRFRVVLQPPGD